MLGAGLAVGGGVGGAFILTSLLVFILARRRKKDKEGKFLTRLLPQYSAT